MLVISQGLIARHAELQTLKPAGASRSAALSWVLAQIRTLASTRTWLEPVEHAPVTSEQILSHSVSQNEKPNWVVSKESKTWLHFAWMLGLQLFAN